MVVAAGELDICLRLLSRVRAELAAGVMRIVVTLMDGVDGSGRINYRPYFCEIGYDDSNAVARLVNRLSR